MQPSSVDLHVDGQFRVFRNNRYPFIDVRNEQPDLTELVEVPDGEPFILHPGEFVLGSTSSGSRYPMTWSLGWRANPRSAASAC